MSAHDIFHVHESEEHMDSHALEAQTGRATMLIVGILLGGLFVLLSYASDWIFSSYTEIDGQNPYSSALALIGAILLGAPIVWHSVKEMVQGHTHMDELVALALVAAIASRDYKAAGAVAFFLLLANLIETRTALGARASIESLLQLSPKKAIRMLAEGGTEEVDPSALRPGDMVRVLPGENIAADGLVRHGQTTVNQANITGESLPVDKAVGDEVFSGTNNVSGAIEVEVTRAGEDTTLGRVRKLILEAESMEAVRKDIDSLLKGHFKPEFLNRIDEIVLFERLSEAMIRSITDLRLAELIGRLAERFIALEISPEARDYIAAQGYDRRFGARPLKRAIQSLLENPLAKSLLSGEVREGDKVLAGASADGLKFTVTRPEGDDASE